MPVLTEREWTRLVPLLKNIEINRQQAAYNRLVAGMTLVKAGEPFGYSKQDVHVLVKAVLRWWEKLNSLPDKPERGRVRGAWPNVGGPRLPAPRDPRPHSSPSARVSRVLRDPCHGRGGTCLCLVSVSRRSRGQDPARGPAARARRVICAALRRVLTAALRREGRATQAIPPATSARSSHEHSAIPCPARSRLRDQPAA